MNQLKIIENGNKVKEETQLKTHNYDKPPVESNRLEMLAEMIIERIIEENKLPTKSNNLSLTNT